MSIAYSIETRQRSAGIAVYDEGAYRFFAADTHFSSMEARRYASVAAVERAARNLEQATGQRPGKRRQDSRGEIFRSWGLAAPAREMA